VLAAAGFAAAGFAAAGLAAAGFAAARVAVDPLDVVLDRPRSFAPCR